MEEILKFKIVNQLKNVYRAISVDEGKESSAEHSWSTLLLTDFFFQTMENKTLDKMKVYELLMYHDIVEIEAGDTHPDSKVTKEEQMKKELVGAKILKDKLPKSMSQKYWDLFIEFEEMKTPESRFAKAMDKFDAVIQKLDYKKDWKGWSRERLYNMKIKYIEEFPKVKDAFMKVLDYAEKEGYFNQ